MNLSGLSACPITLILLDLAIELVLVFSRTAQTQASLRRAVSTAYYALFHLLISDTVEHWIFESSRGRLSRMFEHGLMKRVSGQHSDPRHERFAGEDPDVVRKLTRVAGVFVGLQDKRHKADYDNTAHWTQAEAFEDVNLAVEVFSDWQSIRHEKIAQDYLVSLLIKPRD